MESVQARQRKNFTLFGIFSFQSLFQKISVSQYPKMKPHHFRTNHKVNDTLNAPDTCRSEKEARIENPSGQNGKPEWI